MGWRMEREGGWGAGGGRHGGPAGKARSGNAFAHEAQVHSVLPYALRPPALKSSTACGRLEPQDWEQSDRIRNSGSDAKPRWVLIDTPH